MKTFDSSAPSGADWRRLLPLLPLALLATLAWVYWPGLGGGFIFDDYPNIVDNVALRVTSLARVDWLAAMMSSPASSLQRPLAMLTFAVNHYFTGLEPRPMKLTNLSIHALNSLLVFGLIRSLLLFALPVRGSLPNRRASWMALLVAACWALHPINFLAVLFIVQRMESLCHTFVFAGLWLYVAGRRRQLAGMGGAGMIVVGLIPCTALGLLAKESAALLPLYAFCIEICLFRFRGSDERRDRRLYALYAFVLVLPALLGVAWLLPQVTSQGAFASRNFTLLERLMTEPRVVLTYLRWIVVPDVGQLSLYHDDYPASRGLWNPPTTALALLAISGLLAVAWFCRQRRPLIGLGLLWFFSAQLLTATIIPLELVYEHRNYFASLGICLALADLVLGTAKTTFARTAGTVALLGFLAICSAITHLRALEWRDQVRFSLSEAANHPQSPRATYDAARTMVILTGYHADSPLTARTFAALERARQVPNSGILPDQATLMFAARTGRPLEAEWWQDMDDKLRHQPIGAQELASLGALTKCATERHCPFPQADMLNMYAAALSQGEHPEVLNVYGDYASNALGDDDLALRLWQTASARKPAEPQYHANLAKLYVKLGRVAEAREQIAALRKLGRLGQNEKLARSIESQIRPAKTPRAQ